MAEAVQLADLGRDLVGGRIDVELSGVPGGWAILDGDLAAPPDERSAAPAFRDTYEFRPLRPRSALIASWLVPLSGPALPSCCT
jgi:hypothetical protein